MIDIETHETWSVLHLQRTDRANALSAELCHLIMSGVRASIERNDRALVITGSGNSFSAGADFAEVGTPEFGPVLAAMLRTVQQPSFPVIAAVNGYAIGGGLQLALACDLRVAVADASFGLPTARLGVAVDPWTIERLAALIGVGAARRMLMTCRRYGADDPTVAGLIDEHGSLDDARSLAADLASMAPLTLTYIKTATSALARGEFGSTDVQHQFDAVWASSDSTEGLQAKSQGRAPLFTGT